jgi:ubiquitin carboxyl-terminal hydrolase 4/11/15
MVESPDKKLGSDKTARERSNKGSQHHKKADLNSLHTPPPLFPAGISNSFKRARTTSPPTSIEEGGSETEAEAALVSTPSSESHSESAWAKRDSSSSSSSSPQSASFPHHSGNPAHTHQQTPLRFSFGMSSSNSHTNKAAVDGLLTEKMLNITVPDAEASGSSSSSSELPANGHSLTASEGISTNIQPSETKPDASQQIQMVKESSKEALQIGQSWFLVDRKWYRLWSAACSDGPDSKEGEPLEVGPVETRALWQAGQQEPLMLRLDLEEGVDFELLQESAWRLLTSW